MYEQVPIFPISVNPLVPKGSTFDEYNRLALDRVKSISHYWALKG